MTTEIDSDRQMIRTRNASISARRDRDKRILDVQWRIERHQRELRLGNPTTESAETIQALDQYVDDLCNVPDQAGFPMEIQWPTKPV